ncbi:MAG: acetyltransferase [Frankiales bacterium]|nr:acetyltransferase [Frankiales bacterium]
MTGREPRILLASMDAVCDDVEWVFCTVAALPAAASPIVTVVEDEGLTIVVRRDEADELELAYTFVAAHLTLRVVSALDAIGLTAAVSRALADREISANVVAGFFHDHVFVPFDRRADALAALAALPSGAAR